MTNQEIADQKRLADILRLARLQLNEEFMSAHSSSQAAWLSSARSAWTSTGVLLPFTSKFVYPTEEEVVARGVNIYNSLNVQAVAPAPAPAPAPAIPVAAPVAAPVVATEQAIVQAGGDIVLIEEPVLVEEPIVVAEVAPVVEEPIVVAEVAPVVEEPVVIAPQAESILESKFKSLFTKWGGKGNY